MNALVITAPPDVIASLKSVIRQLDLRRAQVLIEGGFAELTADTAIQLGVQWRFTKTPENTQGAIGGTIILWSGHSNENRFGTQ